MRDKYHLSLGECCLIGLGSNSPLKNWPVERFVEVAKAMNKLGMKVAIIDHEKDTKLIDEFAAEYGDKFFNLGIEADLPRLFVLIKHSFMVIANDTSFVHLAIALRAPSICILNNEGMGAYSFYGDENINKWVFDDTHAVSSVMSVEAGAVIEGVPGVDRL